LKAFAEDSKQRLHVQFVFMRHIFLCIAVAFAIISVIFFGASFTTTLVFVAFVQVVSLEALEALVDAEATDFTIANNTISKQDNQGSTA
jgi:membrane protein YdbS with pleckstrin-like domain